MTNIPEDIQASYQSLHESTGESYESIAKRADKQSSPNLAAWLRSKAAGESELTELEARGQEPIGRRSLRSETAAAEAETERLAVAAKAKQEEDDRLAAEAVEAVRLEAEAKAAAESKGAKK